MLGAHLDHRRLFGALLCLAITGLVAGSVGSVFAAEPDTRLDDVERQQLLSLLRETMHQQQGWVRIHAAESLLWHGHATEVAAAFAEEVETSEPPYRIGVWRVMAQAAPTPQQRDQCLDRIRQALRDTTGPDRVHAAESLAKLRAPLTAEDRQAAEELAASPDPATAVYPLWLLYQSGDRAIRGRFFEIVRADAPIARLRAAYVIRHLEGTLSESEHSTLLEAIAVEPDESPATAYLLGTAWLATPPGTERGVLSDTLRHLITAGTPGDRYAMATVIGEAGTQEDESALRALLVDEDADVRQAASNALLRIDRRMPHHMGALDWWIIGIYMLAMLLVGWYYSRRVTTTDEYLLGGRSMKPWAVGLSLFATLLSTISYLSWPGEMIKHGPMMLCALLAYPFIAVAVGWALIPYFMRLNVTSAYEVLEARFGLSVRMVGSLFFLSLRLLWMAVIIYATISQVIVPLLGLDQASTPWLCALLGVITIIYTSLGGLRAVVVTDVAQTLILFGGAILTMGVVTWQLGGVSAWWPTEWDPNWQEPQLGYDPAARVTLVGAFIATFTWFVCTAGSDQMAIQRYLATRDVASARRMFFVSLAAGGAVQLFLALLGFALLAYFRTHPHQLADGQSIAATADQLFPQFIVFALPTGISGLVVGGLFAAAMSSLSSGLNSSCSVVTVDFIDRFRKNRESEIDHVRLARYTSVVIGAVVVLLSSYVGIVQGNMLEIAYKVVNLLVAPLFGLFFMALFVRWATPFGTLVGAVAGLTTACAINYWQELTGTPGISFLWAMPLSLLAQIALGMLASLLPIGRPAAIQPQDLFVDPER